MNHIELFAGCGGLSLGLESAGFDLIFANELSPMASETFAYNHLGLDLTAAEEARQVYWISSSYPRSQWKSRLRENPFDASGLDDKYSDLMSEDLSEDDLSRSLLVGSIVDLNTLLSSDRPISHVIKKMAARKGVDVVSGGPPCQSFSMAGLRDHTHNRNKLPWEFAKFVKEIKPKIAVLENVSGILRPFTIDGEKHYAWKEVAKAFAIIGYVPLCLHVNAKYVGAAQNRPRFVMIAIRLDVAGNILANSNDIHLLSALKNAVEFSRGNQSGDAGESLQCHHVEKHDDIFRSQVFSGLSSIDTSVVSVKDAIDDLLGKNRRESDYVRKLNSTFKSPFNVEPDKFQNHEFRKNSFKVQARFRLYQVIARMHDKSLARQIDEYIRTLDPEQISDPAINVIRESWLLSMSGEKIQLTDKKAILLYLNNLHTKKHSQRALIAKDPAPAALSIPDDACHYDLKTQRTLTVREMARIQSFPDWFSIRSKVTTGGQMRRFEVPQYTQVGNAVPPLLGLALGEVCRDLLLISASQSKVA